MVEEVWLNAVNDESASNLAFWQGQPAFQQRLRPHEVHTETDITICLYTVLSVHKKRDRVCMTCVHRCMQNKHYAWTVCGHCMQVRPTLPD